MSDSIADDVERVARAMCRAAMYDPDFIVMGSGGTGDAPLVAYRRKWQDFAPLAAAAIAEVRIIDAAPHSS